jgi:hypothetical protein
MMPPTSAKRSSQLRLADEIRKNGAPATIPCDHCFSTGADCIVMSSSSRRLKCSECVRLQRPCVNMSWSSLDKTREEYAKKVEEDEVLLAEVLARLMRNKKILKQAEERAKRKAECLANELVESGELDEAQPGALDCPAANALVGFSPTLWSTLGALDEFGGAGVPVVGGS